MDVQLAQLYLMQLALAAGVLSQEEFGAFIQNLVQILQVDVDLNSEQGIVDLATACAEALQQDENAFGLAVQQAASGEVPQGRFGMKVYNLMRLRGVCTPGSLVSYYKIGGKVCKKCVKKQEAGGKTKRNTGTSIEDYKAEYAQRKADYANLYRHLQSKSVGGAIDAQPKYSGKGPNGISKHRGGHSKSPAW